METTLPNINFIKSVVKIANPTWTIEQIELEAKRKLEELANPTSSEDCEFCSS